MLHISYHSNQTPEIWVSCDNAIQTDHQSWVQRSIQNKGKSIRCTKWPLGSHRFLNNKDGSKTWLSDDNTKEGWC